MGRWFEYGDEPGQMWPEVLTNRTPRVDPLSEVHNNNSLVLRYDASYNLRRYLLLIDPVQKPN